MDIERQTRVLGNNETILVSTSGTWRLPLWESAATLWDNLLPSRVFPLMCLQMLRPLTCHTLKLII